MPALTPATVTDAITHEQQHVHAIYDSIAPHFSSTRYKPWPLIAAFLAARSAGSVGVDMGTGNGKYLPLVAGWMVGVDRSEALLEIARGRDEGEGDVKGEKGEKGRMWEVVRGDVRDGAMWRAGAFDYALSIATIHHLATHVRRRSAVEALLRCVNAVHGRVLIYVWAVEQDALSRRVVPAGTGAGGQDVFVPWVMRGTKGGVVQRYYHLFAEGELRALVCDAAGAMGLVVGVEGESESEWGVEIVREGWERSNWYVELQRWRVEKE